MTDKHTTAPEGSQAQVQRDQSSLRKTPQEERDPLLPWSVVDDGTWYLIMDGDDGNVGKIRNREDADRIVNAVNGASHDRP